MGLYLEMAICMTVWVAVGLWAFGMAKRSKAEASGMDGCRFQTRRALRGLARGDMAVMEMECDAPHRRWEDEKFREKWFEYLKDVEVWRKSDVVAVLVPGTWFSRPIGRRLLENGWVEPVEESHWIGNLRFYRITAAGREAHSEYERWWGGLSFNEKVFSVLTE